MNDGGAGGLRGVRCAWAEGELEQKKKKKKKNVLADRENFFWFWKSLQSTALLDAYWHLRFTTGVRVAPNLTCSRT